ncbi:MAG: glycine oxidase ThiO [Candidatus Dormibacteraeota bacterium]|nr:glycine oxidase ThiO [Candidatus Dormibacteraeota bacterium]
MSESWAVPGPPGGECVVVGAGVIGLSVALALARAGLGVTVLEREPECGRGTSAAAAGMLAAGVEAAAPGAFFNLCRSSFHLWPEWSAQLQDESKVDCELELGGLLRVTTSAEGAVDLEVKRAWQLTQGIQVSELLSLEHLRREVAGLGPDVVAGLVYPNEGHVHSHRVLEALLGACIRLGVTIETSAPADGVAPEGDRPVVHVGGQQPRDLAADYLVLATGTWSPPLLQEVGVEVAMEPVRGQMLAISPGGMVLPRIVFGDHGYLLQKRSGLVLAGATEERVGFQSWTTLDGVLQVAAAARRLLPALGPARFAGSWAGLRPFARGGPLLGRSPASPRVLLATGHHRNGVLLAPITAELIARAVLEGEDPPELAPFSPGRQA